MLLVSQEMQNDLSSVQESDSAITDESQCSSANEYFPEEKAVSDIDQEASHLKPKRPLSAYNFFFQAQRQSLLEEMPTRPEGKPRRSHGKIGFAAMARIIAGRWKAIGDEARNYYETLATQDKARYVQQMEQWKARQKADEKLKPPPAAIGDAPKPFDSHNTETLERLMRPLHTAESQLTLDAHNAFLSATMPSREVSSVSSLSNTAHSLPPLTQSTVLASLPTFSSPGSLLLSSGSLMAPNFSGEFGLAAALPYEGSATGQFPLPPFPEPQLSNPTTLQPERSQRVPHQHRDQRAGALISELAHKLDEDGVDMLVNLFRRDDGSPRP